MIPFVYCIQLDLNIDFVFMFVVPELIAPPEVSALSPTSLEVKWSSTEGRGLIARGRVTEYRVNLVTEQSNNPYAPPFISQARRTHLYRVRQV